MLDNLQVDNVGDAAAFIAYDYKSQSRHDSSIRERPMKYLILGRMRNGELIIDVLDEGIDISHHLGADGSILIWYKK